jgi:Adaptin C-terminal domain
MINCRDITNVILYFNLMPSSMTPFFPSIDSTTLPTLSFLPSSLAQAAVPKYLKLEMLPASSSSIPPNSSGAVTQEIRVVNSQQGEKNIMLKLKIGYFQGGVQVCYTTIY